MLLHNHICNLIFPRSISMFDHSTRPDGTCVVEERGLVGLGESLAEEDELVGGEMEGLSLNHALVQMGQECPYKDLIS